MSSPLYPAMIWARTKKAIRFVRLESVSVAVFSPLSIPAFTEVFSTARGIAERSAKLRQIRFEYHIVLWLA